jgi:hypothetical protein
MKRQKRAPTPATAVAGVPFDNAEEAWFWTTQCLLARNDGARIVAGLGLVTRPCEPEDLLGTVERLHRQGPLTRHHLGVLADYGRRLQAPDARNRGEERAARLWDEALDRCATVWRRKGIVL